MKFISRHRLKFFGFVIVALLVWIIIVNLWSPTKKVRFKLQVNYGVDDPQFRSTISSLLGPPLVGGNRVTALLNGDQIFPAMLSAIREAKTSITLETFIYWKGVTGDEFTDALSARARQGVRVSVLLDWLGSRQFDASLLKRLKDAGVTLLFYHPVRWYDLDRLNNRTHRRLLVVDGKVGFIGGVGIADEWQGNGLAADHWRDTHYKVEGPVVSQLQAAFGDNWIRTQENVLQGQDYFPAPLAGSEGTQMFAQVFKSSADEGTTSARLLFLYSIVAARKTIDIENAYFLPDDQFVEELIKAVQRGVRVRIIAPHLSDSRIVLKASHASWGKLMAAGIEIWTYMPAMLHNKLMVIDSIWTTVGSANFDPRSFRLNKEANLNVLDPGFAGEQIRHFDDDLKVSHRVLNDEWDDRSNFEKIGDQIFSILSPQL